MSTIQFEANLYTIGAWTILRLPERASAQLPSRGMTMVAGTINGAPFKAKPCSSRMAGMHQGNNRATGLDLTKSCWMTLVLLQAIRYTLRLNRPTNGSSQTFLTMYSKRWQRPPQPRRYGRTLRKVAVGIEFAESARSKHQRPAKSI